MRRLRALRWVLLRSGLLADALEEEGSPAAWVLRAATGRGRGPDRHDFYGIIEEDSGYGPGVGDAFGLDHFPGRVGYREGYGVGVLDGLGYAGADAQAHGDGGADRVHEAKRLGVGTGDGLERPIFGVDPGG